MRSAKKIGPTLEPGIPQELLWRLSPDGFIDFIAREVSSTLGWNDIEAVGKHFLSFTHETEIDRLRESFLAATKGETVELKEVQCLCKDGSYANASFSLIPCFSHSVLFEVLLLGSFSGVSRSDAVERTKPLRNPQAAEISHLTQVMESVLANAPVGFAVLDEDLRFVCLNRTFSGMTGFSPAQQVGQPLADIFLESAHLIIPNLLSILRTGKSIVDQEVTLQGDGEFGTARYAQMSFYPMPTEIGTNCGVALIAIDVTERKKAELSLQNTKEELERSNLALESFSSIASHDLREPLRTVSMFVKLLERKLEGTLDNETQECMGFIVGGTTRMHKLIERVLEFAKAGQSKSDFSDVDCSEILKTTQANLEVALKETGAKLTNDALPIIWGNESNLIQVFQNLIENSVKYRSKLPLKIHVGAKKQGDRWVISFADNGIGISPEHFTDIFAPFRRLHPLSEYEGSGLGLAICQKNIQKMGSEIKVASELGKGTTFSFSLPAPSRGLRYP